MTVLGISEHSNRLRIVESLGPEFAARRGLLESCAPSNVEYIRTTDHLDGVFRDLQSTAGRSIEIFDPGNADLDAPMPPPVPTSPGRPDMQCRVVFAPSAVQHDVSVRRPLGTRWASFEMRVYPKVPAKLVIRDREEALIVGAEEHHGGAMGIHILSPWLASFLHETFETIWQAAMPLSPTHLAAPHLFSSEEREILRLLASGLTDESIARSFGVSQRTIQRKVQQIQRRVGAISRFQLGAMTAA
ncbi:hypothetical protein GCM10009715_34510 [Paeniglutamicibacter psychrophenolicus]|uniref:DNA-binding CsgD family transcriptional regulator n=1 Tax=Paeniglutamicibacter psychrophenolicus TaxID=257454 RepID=A0ABS4WA07_9MICC|nr:helix-turn-helix transcriptional regulator [Paeniglutamicibacter psychrophenolicus]MBP2373039.1 DNA-binding CsgD family transcriptional regulator [Paeniglutamicibacter psychrophenolicus]